MEFTDYERIRDLLSTIQSLDMIVDMEVKDIVADLRRKEELQNREEYQSTIAKLEQLRVTVHAYSAAKEKMHDWRKADGR